MKRTAIIEKRSFVLGLFLGTLSFLTPAFAVEDPEQLPGWPVQVAIQQEGQTHHPWVIHSPAISDLDGDGYPEVVAAGNITEGFPPGAFPPPEAFGRAVVGVYRWDGRPHPGWPQIIDGTPLGLGGDALSGSAPLLGDLDRDGRLEIVQTAFWREQFAGVVGSAIFAWRENGTLLPGWPIRLDRFDRFVPSHQMLADLNGDGRLEVIVVTWTWFRAAGDNGVSIYVWDASGNPLPEWPVIIPYGSDPFLMSHGVAVGNVVGDQAPELVLTIANVSSNLPQEGDPPVPTVSLVILDRQGKVLLNQPVPQTDSLTEPPVLGDLDQDGTLEIVLGGTSANNLEVGLVYVFRGNGEAMPGWPRQTGRSPVIALADFEGDGSPELVVGSSAREHLQGGKNVTLTVFDARGSVRDGWPVPIEAHGRAAVGILQGPVVGDIDGDQRLEISATQFLHLAGLLSSEYTLAAWHEDGRQVKGFPLSLGGPVPLGVTALRWLAAPSIVDLDKDGTVEMIVPQGASQFINAFKLKGRHDPSGLPWPVYRHDAQRSGMLPLASRPNAPPEMQPIPRQWVDEGQTLRFSVRAGDPDGDPLTLIARLANGDPLETIGASFTVDPTNGTGTFQWIPPFSFVDSQQETRTVIGLFEASDGRLDVQEVVPIAVRNVERNSSRGDANGDGQVDIADPIFIINYLFRGGPPPATSRADVDGDGKITGADFQYLLRYLFLSGPAPIDYLRGDVDGNGGLNVSDCVFIRLHLSGQGSALTVPAAADLDGDLEVTQADMIYLLEYLFRQGSAPVAFRRGDANADGRLNILDATFLNIYLARRIPAPPIPEAADVNGDGRMTSEDPLYLLRYLFERGPAPAPVS